MYYLAEFLNYPPLLEQKIGSFVKENALDCFLYYHEQDISLISSEYLSIFNNSQFTKPWFIHGSCLSKVPLNVISQLPLVSEISLEKIDTFISWFLNHYDWSIIPWGGSGKRFNCFAFISNKHYLRDSFIAASSNMMSIIGVANIQRVNLFIASYDIPEAFSHVARAVILNEDLAETGTLIWNICNCTTENLPLIVTLLFPLDEDDNEPPDCWEHANYRLINILEFTTKEKSFSGLPQRLGVYEPQDLESFIAMLQIHWSEPDTLIVVPNNTKFDSLSKLLEKTEAHSFYSSCSDLSFFQEILDLSEWFYGVDRDRSDFKYSLFVSQNHQFIRQIDNFCQKNSNYHLISLF